MIADYLDDKQLHPYNLHSHKYKKTGDKHFTDTHIFQSFSVECVNKIDKQKKTKRTMLSDMHMQTNGPFHTGEKTSNSCQFMPLSSP